MKKIRTARPPDNYLQIHPTFHMRKKAAIYLRYQNEKAKKKLTDAVKGCHMQPEDVLQRAIQSG